MIAVITAAISCLWFFLKPAEKDPTLVTLYGNVDIRQFDIGFQVPGQITKMYFEEGDTVQEGSLVAEIDAEDYKLQEAKSESEVAKAYAASMPAQIITDSTDPQTGTRKTYQGHIGYISPVSEFTPKSVQTTDLRTDLVYMIRVYADNPDKFLRQGMPTTVLIDLKDSRGK